MDARLAQGQAQPLGSFELTATVANITTPAHTAPATAMPSRGLDGDDLRIAALRAAFAAGGYSVLSLDVFDTLVWRRALRPSDVFFQLAKRLAPSTLRASFQRRSPRPMR